MIVADTDQNARNSGDIRLAEYARPGRGMPTYALGGANEGGTTAGAGGAAAGREWRAAAPRAAAEAGMIDKIGGGHSGGGARAMDTEQAAMLALIGQGSLAADIPTDDGERLDKEAGTDGAT